MEEEKNDNEKKGGLVPKQNNLEKLIKLDQKNSSQTLFTKAHRRRLLIRDQALSSTFSWTPNPTEQSLYAFWSHIGQYYFKALKEEDMERLDLLMQGSQLENKSETPKYTGLESYGAFKSILAPEYKKLYPDQILSRQNYENLRKKYYLSTVKMTKSMRKLKPSTNPPTFSYDLPGLKSAKSKGKVKGFLQEETKQLDGFMNKIVNKDDDKADFLEEEIDKFAEEFKKVSKENIKNLNALKQRASKKEKPVLDINEIIGSSRVRTPGKDKWSSSMKKSRDRTNTLNSHSDLKTTFVEYLKDVIIRLENQQAAESIKYVVDCKKPVVAGEKYKFCVIFDEAIRSTESWVEEPVLDKLDKMREQSLFKVYKIPQKTYHSVNSQNLVGFYFCDQKVANRVGELKERPWKDLIKKGFMEGTKGFSKEELFMKSKEFAICHHCKYLFPEEFLVRCTYRSSDLKLPQSNSEYMNSLAYNGNIPKRSIWNNKRTAASFYQKRNGDNVCLRAYCKLCLKQNFDSQMLEGTHKPNWICPFCNGICNCTRCLRYDNLNKLMSLFSLLGGDLEVIKEESYSEKYIYGAGSEGPLDKAYKKTSYYALKPTKGGKTAKESKEVKGKLDVYKGTLERYQALKDLRIKLERIRLLCSQVARRERMKIRLDAVKNKILEEYVEKLESSKAGKRGSPDFDFMDIEPKLLKKLKTSAAKMLAPTKGKGQIKSNGKMIADDLTLIPVKRKRGRPRKDASLLFPELDELSVEKVPKKRGRKKKEETVEKELKNYIRKTPTAGEDKNRKIVVKIPTKKRGRPRKIDVEQNLQKQKKLQKLQKPQKQKRKQRRRMMMEDEAYEPEESEEEQEEREEEEEEEDLEREFEDEEDEELSGEESEEVGEEEEEEGSEEGSEDGELEEEGEDEEDEEDEEEDDDEVEEVRKPRRRNLRKLSPKIKAPNKKDIPKRRVGRPRKIQVEELSENDESEDDEENSQEEEDEDEQEEGDEEEEEEEGDEGEEEGDEDEDEDEDDEDEDDDDDEEEESFKLPRELQGILTHQNADQFDVFTHTLDARRVTRSLYHSKQKGRKGRKRNRRT